MSRYEPNPIVEDSKVINAGELKRYFKERYRRNSIIRYGMFLDLPVREASPLLEKPEEPAWAREQWQSVQQLRAMVNHLNNKVTELRAKRKPKGKY